MYEGNILNCDLVLHSLFQCIGYPNNKVDTCLLGVYFWAGLLKHEVSYLLGCLCNCSEGQGPRGATALSGHSRREVF